MMGQNGFATNGERCPYLVPVMADRLWLYPVSDYCRRPGAGVRVPAAVSLASRCLQPEHRVCPGYLASSVDQAVTRTA